MNTPSTNLLNRLGNVLAVEGRACGFVVGVVTCALLLALLYFAARLAFSGMPE
jgi:hypothetical protein